MKLSKTEIKNRMTTLNGWGLHDEAIKKQFSCKNFTAVVEYVNQIANIAEKMDHHPDLLIHDYNKLTITITTHSENGLTHKDFELAHKIDRLSVIVT